MNFWSIIGGMLFVWWVVSQVIAWMITPTGDEDDVVNVWAAVFLAPAIWPIILIGRVERAFYRFARRTGFTWRLM